MNFNSRSQFVLWSEKEVSAKLGCTTSWIAPSKYEQATKQILNSINTSIIVPNPHGNGTWKGISDYAGKIYDQNQKILNNGSSSSSYSSAYASSCNGSYSSHNMSSKSPSSSYNSQSSCADLGMVKSHNFDSALKKIKRFSNEIPYIPELEKFDTDGGLFGWGDHYINGHEMNSYVEKVQDMFRAHNEIIIKTIQEFRDVYSTFDYLDKEYLFGIVQTATAAAKASEGAKAASNQAKTASEQAKAAAEKALINEADLKKDVENLRKLVDKIRSIKEDLTAKIEITDSSLSHKIGKIEKAISEHLLSPNQIAGLQNQINTINQLEKKVTDLEHILITEIEKLTQIADTHNNNIEYLTKYLEKAEKTTLLVDVSEQAQTPINNSQTGLIWAYIIGGLGLVCSICSLVLQ